MQFQNVSVKLRAAMDGTELDCLDYSSLGARRVEYIWAGYTEVGLGVPWHENFSSLLFVDGSVQERRPSCTYPSILPVQFILHNTQ